MSPIRQLRGNEKKYPINFEYHTMMLRHTAANETESREMVHEDK